MKNISILKISFILAPILFVVIVLVKVGIGLMPSNEIKEVATYIDTSITNANDYNLLLWVEFSDTTTLKIGDKHCLPHISLVKKQSNATLVVYKGETYLLGARHSFDGITSLDAYVFDIDLRDIVYGTDSTDIIRIPVSNIYKKITPLKVSESKSSDGECSFSAIEKNDGRSAWICRNVSGYAELMAKNSPMRRSYVRYKGHKEYGWTYGCPYLISLWVDRYLYDELGGSTGSALLNSDGEVVGVAALVQYESPEMQYEIFVSVRALK